jgi:hypothetical protein
VKYTITLEVDDETGVFPARDGRLTDGRHLGDRIPELAGYLGHGHAARRGGDTGIPHGNAVFGCDDIGAADRGNTDNSGGENRAHRQCSIVHGITSLFRRPSLYQPGVART